MCQEHLLSVSGGLHPLEISLDSEVGDHLTILLPECADCLSATEKSKKLNQFYTFKALRSLYL